MSEMKQVRGHEGWWKVSEFPTGSALYKFFTKMGRESKVFISMETSSGRRTSNYKYEVFLSGAGRGDTAGYVGGSSTLSGAIKLANKKKGELG